MAVAEALKIESDLLPKIATGFCSGMARTGGFCGALSGGVMALGLVSGRSAPAQTVDLTYTRIQTLLQQFETQFGSTNCAQLTGGHLGTPEGQAHFKATNQHANCLNYAETVTRMVLALCTSAA